MHNNNVLMSFNYVLCSPLEYLVYKNTGIIFSTFILQKGISPLFIALCVIGNSHCLYHCVS